MLARHDTGLAESFDGHVVLNPVIESACDCAIGIHVQDLCLMSKSLQFVGAQAIELIVWEARECVLERHLVDEQAHS
jgi:hypothetical protein